MDLYKLKGLAEQLDFSESLLARVSLLAVAPHYRRPGILEAMDALSLQAGRAWIAAMERSVEEQKVLLGRLLELVSQEDMVRYLLISCSLARNAGDRLSDIDAELGIEDGAYPTGIVRIKELLGRLGPVVDTLEHTLPSDSGHERQHIITVYENNLQLSLVVTPSSWVSGLKPNAVALYDPYRQLAKPWVPAIRLTSSAAAREWAFLAWLNLTDCIKYLERGSLWGALERLHRARNNTWQLWAVANKLDFALYGITQLIDDDVPPPEGMERTVAILEKDSIRTAWLVLADILEDVITATSKVVPFDSPSGMALTAQQRFREYK